MGFAGDGGPAAAAQLNTPLALALDGSNHLYIADSGNQRIRIVDLTTGTIRTLVGNGRQGFSGDNGPALEAALDTPSGLAADRYSNLFISDSGNHRIREVSSASQKIVTLAGDGASGIRLTRPEGLSLDLRGGLLISDAATHSIYLFDLASGHMSIVAGLGTQAFEGDRGLATLAMLDSPMGVAFGPTGSIAIADTNNGRLRQVTSENNGTISTIAGAGSRLRGVLALISPSASAYGSAALTATFPSTSLSNGSVNVYEITSSRSNLLGTSPLVNGAANLSLPALSVGNHQLFATFSGDDAYQPAQSSDVSLTISPLSISASVTLPTLVYGQPVPTLLGSLTGVLPQDSANVALSLSFPNLLYPLVPGTYPVQASLTGSAAADYALSGGSASLTVGKAPAIVSVTHSVSGFLIDVASTTAAGRPTGAVALLTAAGNQLASVPVSAAGQTTVSDAGLTPGTYSIAAIYSGDSNFLSARSQQISVTVGASVNPLPGSDFSLTTTGANALTVQPGGTASYTFGVQAASGALAGPVVLSVQGAPAMSTTNLTPTLVSPGTTAATVTLNVVLPSSASKSSFGPRSDRVCWALLLPLLCLPWRRGRLSKRYAAGLLGCLTLMLSGCGDRVVSGASTQSSTQTYSLIVTGTTTNADGSTLQHSSTVKLSVP